MQNDRILPEQITLAEPEGQIAVLQPGYKLGGKGDLTVVAIDRLLAEDGL